VLSPSFDTHLALTVKGLDGYVAAQGSIGHWNLKNRNQVITVSGKNRIWSDRDLQVNVSI
jgi:hypothetical protein